MSAEEKTKELVANFIVGTLRMPTLSNNQAKACAIICVDEIMKANLMEYPQHNTIYSPHKNDYWQEVKKTNNPIDMSKEDIIEKHSKMDFDKSEFPNGYPWVEKAMEDWAKIKSREKAIAFAAWMDYGEYICTLHTDDGIKLWEKQDEYKTTGDRRKRPKPLSTNDLYDLFLQQTESNE